MAGAPGEADVSVLLARLAELERRVDEQAAELRALRADGAETSGAHEDAVEADREDGSPGVGLEQPGADRAVATDRRGFVRAAAAAATGAVVGSVVLAVDASPAAANDGNPLVIGSSVNVGTQATGLAVTGDQAAYGIGATDNGVNSVPGFPALLGHAKQTNFFIGVLGLGEGGATGVEGRSASGNGVSALSTSGVGARASGGRAALKIDGFGQPPPGRSDLHVSGEVDVDLNGDLWYCATGGTPGTWRKVAGPATAGAFHVLPSTVRIYDSRPGNAPLGVVKGALGNFASRTVDAKVGGGVPAGATAVLVNLTIVNTTDIGYLALHKNGIPFPGNSTINWGAPGTLLANSAVCALDDQARLAVKSNVGFTDFVIDVLGYYR